MGLYEGIKDVASIVQKADNIELYRQLLDLSAQALDLQNKVNELTAENDSLKKQRDIEAKICRHKEDLYITLKDNDSGLLYCASCWDNNRKLIQVRCDENGEFTCPVCHTDGIYDQNAFNRHVSEERAALDAYVNRPRNPFGF